MDLFYSRPAANALHGHNLVQLLSESVFADNIAGGRQKTGFPLLYEMLTGSIHARVLKDSTERRKALEELRKKRSAEAKLLSPAADDARKAELESQAKDDQDESARTRDVAPTMARILTHALFVKMLMDGEDYKLTRPPQILAAVLAVLLTAHEIGYDVSRFPSFPLKKNVQGILSLDRNVPPLIVAFSALKNKGLKADQAELAPFLRRLGSACKEFLTFASSKEAPASPFNVSFEKPTGTQSVCLVPPNSTLNVRPQVRDCSLDTRTLQETAAKPLSGVSDLASLSITAADVAAFANRPLYVDSVGLTEHIDIVQEHNPGQLLSLSVRAVRGSYITAMLIPVYLCTDSSLLSPEMPFRLNDTAKRVLRSPVAQSMHSRIRDDFVRLADDSKRAKAPRLRYLQDVHIQTLRAALSDAKSGKAPAKSDESGKVLEDALVRLHALLDALRTLQTDDRAQIERSSKSVQQVAINGSVGQSEGKSAQPVVDAEQIRKDRLAFELERAAGLRVTPWFELVAALYVSARGSAELRRLNPFLTEEDVVAIDHAVGSVLFRTVRLSQTCRCIAGCLTLIENIKQLLARRLKEALRGSLVAPTPEMLTFALAKSQYSESKARSLVSDILRAQESLVAGLPAEVKTNGPQMVAVALHFHAFDESSTRGALADAGKRALLLTLARLGFYTAGQRLIQPAPPLAMQRAASGSARAVELGGEMSVSAMVHVLQHKAEELARDLTARRHYTESASAALAAAAAGGEKKAAGDKSGFVFDPRFLVFEFMQGICLHKRQIALIRDFMRSAKGGKSTVHQMIMGAGEQSLITLGTAAPCELVRDFCTYVRALCLIG